MIQAVIFERAGTLVRERTDVEILQELLQPLGHVPGPEALAGAVESAQKDWAGRYGSLPRGQRWTPEIRAEYRKAALTALQLPGGPAEMVQRADQYWESYRIRGLFAGAHPCLGALRASRIGLAALDHTLRGSIEVRAELERLGVGRYFQVVHSTEDMPWDRPDPRVFQFMVERLKVPVERVLYVSDDARGALPSAQEAGLARVLVDRNEENPVEGMPAVRTLVELPGLITTLG